MVSHFSNSSLKVTRQEVLKKFSKVWAKAQRHDPPRGDIVQSPNNFRLVWMMSGGVLAEEMDEK